MSSPATTSATDGPVTSETESVASEESRPHDPVEPDTASVEPDTESDVKPASPSAATIDGLAAFIKGIVDESGVTALYDGADERDFDAFWHVSDARSDEEKSLREELSFQSKTGLVGPILASVRADSTAVEFNNAVQAMLNSHVSPVDGAGKSDDDDVDDASVNKHGTDTDTDQRPVPHVVAALFLAGGADTGMVHVLTRMIEDERAFAAEHGRNVDAVRDGSLADACFGQPDSRWYQHDYTGALLTYSSIGSIWLNEERRAKLRRIYWQRMDNIATLKYAVGLLVLIAAFMGLFHTGLFSGSGHVPMIVLCVLALIGIGVFAVLWFRKKPYNNLNGIIGLVYVVWVVYALSVVLW